MSNLNSTKLELFETLEKIIRTFDSSDYSFSVANITNSMVGEIALNNYEPVRTYIDEKRLWLAEQQEIIRIANDLLEKCISKNNDTPTEDICDTEKKTGLIWKIINMHFRDYNVIRTGLLTNDLSPVIAQLEKKYTDSSCEQQRTLTEIIEIKDLARRVEKRTATPNFL